MNQGCPNDTTKIIETLIRESRQAIQYAPLIERLLLQGAIIDAEDLLAEIKGSPRNPKERK